MPAILHLKQPSKSLEDGSQIETATNIPLDQINHLSRNQKKNVKGVFTMGIKEPKEVTKRNGKKGHVKEDCIAEDESGYSIIHIWDELIEGCKDKKAYEFMKLTVKNYSGHTHLGTNEVTTIKEIDMKIENSKAKEILANLQKPITIKEFLFTDRVNIFTTCQVKSCRKKMPFTVGSTIITCNSCGMYQKAKGCNKEISARLCIEQEEGQTIWLTAFTSVLKKMLEKIGQSIDGTTDHIKEGLMQIETSH